MIVSPLDLGFLTDFDVESIIAGHRRSLFHCSLWMAAAGNADDLLTFEIIAQMKAARIAELRRHHTLFRAEGDLA